MYLNLTVFDQNNGVNKNILTGIKCKEFTSMKSKWYRQIKHEHINLWQISYNVKNVLDTSAKATVYNKHIAL